MDIGQLVTSVAATLNDPGFTRWTVDDLVEYLNDACLQVVNVRPEANAATKVLELTEGTRQTLPAGAVALIEVQRNVPSGRVVRLVDKAALEAAAPLWHGSSRAVDARDYTFDSRDPKTFWVWPPAASTTKVEAIVAMRPDQVTNNQTPWDPFPIDVAYKEPARLWMLHRAYAVDTGAGSLQKSSAYFNQFYQWFGLKAEADFGAEPKQGGDA